MNLLKQPLRIGLLGALSLSVFLGSTFLGFDGNVYAATNHALIVGVSQYENLPEELWLKGPKNDAVLVRDFLIANETRRFEPANIQVLADGVEGAEIATLAAIRTALKGLAATAEPDDFIYLHFSGHGTQAPARDPSTEADGLDELFLPADIGAWDNSIGTVKNALVDDELGELIGAIRAKGAHVWAVFDSCHSGTVTRAAQLNDPLDREVSRKLSPATLGISDAEMDAAMPKTRGLPTPETSSSVESFADAESTADGAGSFVAFYAAQTNQTTPEMRLPEGIIPRQSHGLFTFTLLEATAQNPSMSYRQLAQEILRNYSVQNRVQPTPLFEGDLDFGIFATQKAKTLRQWPVKVSKGEIKIPAGRLHGLKKDEILFLVETAGQSEPNSQIKFEISSISDLSATLIPVSESFAQVKNGVLARKMGTEVDYNFSVAVPSVDSSNEKLNAVVSGLDTLEQDGLRLSIAETNELADVQLTFLDNALWFVARDGLLIKTGADKTPSISFDGKTDDVLLGQIGDNLARMARVSNLTKIGGIFTPSSMGVDVTFTAQNTERDNPFEISPAAVSELVPGDIVFLNAKNTQRDPVDLNVLYIGSDFSISHLYAERLNRGDTLDIDLFDITDESFGRERILVVATPAAPQSSVEDLSWLAQTEIERTRGNESELGQLLREAGFSSTTRAVRRRGGAGGGIAQFLVNVVEKLP